MARNTSQLSRRERQIMDILYERGSASARDVHETLPNAPSYSAVRALLAILVDKGQATFEQAGARYIYAPAQPIHQAREGALQRLVKTFFGGSTLSAANALLGLGAKDLKDEDLEKLSELIEQERARRRV